MIAREIGIDEARPKLGELVIDAQHGIPTVITRHGKRAAALTGILGDDEARQTIAEALVPLGDEARGRLLRWLIGVFGTEAGLRVTDTSEETGQ